MKKSHNSGKIHGKNQNIPNNIKKERNAQCRKGMKQPKN